MTSNETEEKTSDATIPKIFNNCPCRELPLPYIICF
jgi:hypothetical protein